MDKKGRILVICATILVLSFVGTASATNRSVDGSGGADFTGIQDAINKASTGDTILVYSGVYNENVVVDKSVTLKGIGYPVVDAERSGSVITLTGDSITFEGFNVTNSEGSRSDTLMGGVERGAGIKVSSSNNIITDNTASNNDYGIYLYNSNNNTITGNMASNNYDGIYLSSSSHNNITGNNVSNNNRNGIYLLTSCNNTITDNPFNCNNRNGIRLESSSNNNTIAGNTFVNDGLAIDSPYQNTVEDNTVNAKPLVYLKDVSNYKIEDAGQVILINCSNITVENLDLSNISVGIELWGTVDSTISNNTVSNNEACSILLAFSSNNTITGNTVSSNNEYGGIFLWSSSNNNITGNTVCNNDGISIHLSYSSNNNTITGNNVSNNNVCGIFLRDSNNSTITGNNVCNNGNGICLSSSSNNKIYLNSFINNINNIHSYESSNIWNSTDEINYTYNGTTYTNCLGNYWHDYGGRDDDRDGIGDTPYPIDSDSDNYPLMEKIEH
jgi:parallel beta-helix repeat protein